MLTTFVRGSSNNITSSRICIDQYQGDDMKGRIFHVIRKEPICFRGILSFIKGMDELLDTYDFPQAGMKLRTFSTGIKVIEKEPNLVLNETTQVKDVLRGKLATFRIRILFRQNATWQGTIRWVEQGEEQKFRSVLELLMLIDSCFAKDRGSDKTLKEDYQESII